MRRRVGFARAIALQPEILLFDEPNTGLDPLTSAVIDEVIIEMSEHLPVTMVTITHDMRSAFRIADRIAMLRDGTILAVGAPEEFRASSPTRTSRASSPASPWRRSGMSPTARIGLFMMLALVILGVFIVKIEEIPIGAKCGRQRVQAAFPSVAGLDEKSPVRIAGVRIGIVERIALDGDRALVTLALDPDVALHQGARAEVTSLGMLGDKYVELYPGTADGPPLPPGTVLGGVSPVGFDQVLKTADDVGGDIKVVTASLRQSLGGDEGAAAPRRDRREHPAAHRRHTAMVAANRENVDATMDNFRAFSETLKTELPKLAEQLNALADRVDTVVAENRGNLKDSLENIKDLSARLRTSADNINDITGKISRGEGHDRQARQRRGDRQQPQRHPQVGRERRRQPEEHARPLRALEARPQPPHRGAPGLDDNDNSRTTFGLDLQTTDSASSASSWSTRRGAAARRPPRSTTVTYPDGRSETTLTEEQRVTDSATRQRAGRLLLQGPHAARRPVRVDAAASASTRTCSGPPAPAHSRSTTSAATTSLRTSVSRAGTTLTRNVFRLRGLGRPDVEGAPLPALRRRRDPGATTTSSTCWGPPASFGN